MRLGSAFTLKTKTILFLVLSGSIVLFLTVMLAMFLHVWERNVLQMKQEFLQDQSYKMAVMIMAKVHGGPLTDQETEWIARVSGQYGAAIRYVASDQRTVLFDSTDLMEQPAVPFMTDIPVIADGRLTGMLSARYDLLGNEYFPELTGIGQVVASEAKTIYFVLLLAGFIVSYLAAAVLAQPIRSSSRIALQMTRGGHELVIPEVGTAELKQLSHSANALLNKFKNLEKWRKQMMQDLAHELRTPITSVLSRLEAMVDGVYPMTESNVENIYTEMHRLSRLVDDLQKLSDAEGARFTLRMSKVDVVSLIQNVCDGFLFFANDKKLSLHVVPSYAPCYIEGDPDRITQIVSNLISNAIKYTPIGGKIEMGVVELENEVTIYCKDNGIGIEEEDIHRIFNRFYRADKSRSRDGGGLGVGLSIAKVLAEAHDGTIGVVSQPGEGSQFTARFPLYVTRNVPTQQEAAKSQGLESTV